MQSRLHTLWQQLDAVTSRYGFQQPGVLIDQKRQRLGEMSERLSQQIQFVLSMEQSRFQGMSERLLAVSPRSVLARGYSVAYKLPQKQVVNKVESFEIGEKFGLLMSDGEIEADVKKIKSDGPTAVDLSEKGQLIMAKKSDMSFEQAMTRLEEIVKQLEDSAISIEESLALFEEGTELTKMCRSRLEEAEKKIIVLTQNEGDGDDSELES